ncbi:MAG TPA: SH3 domain-containing protein [Streptomyces sp.]|nr:SH3 domain-containing protein [Streptomyces sp.]
MSVEHVEAAENGPAGATGTGCAESATAVEATLVATTYYPIAPGYSVNVRSGPGTSYSIVRVLPEGSQVAINCQSPGTWITGPYGTTNIWDNIASGQYVSDAYVHTGSDGYIRPLCS